MLSITNNLTEAENAFQDECIRAYLQANPQAGLADIELVVTQGEFSRDLEGNLIYTSSCLVRTVGEKEKENNPANIFRVKFVTYI